MYKKLIIILVSTLIVGILAIIFTPSGFATGIYIKIPDGTDITLEVEPVDTVLSLKNKIQKQTSIPIEKQQLFYAEKELADNRTLADYNIQKESIIHLVVKHTHFYGDWIITKQPTCNLEGERQKACGCGDIITESIPSTQNHTPSDWITITEPTYEQEDRQVKHCIICGTELETKVMNKLVKPIPSEKSPFPQTGDNTPNRWITAIAGIVGFVILLSVSLLRSKDDHRS